MGNLTYDAQAVFLPAPPTGQDWTPAVDQTFEGAAFSLWAYGWTGGSGAVLQGVARSPNDVSLSFVVIPDDSDQGRWTSPDAVLGVEWTGHTQAGIGLLLLVSDPFLAYSAKTTSLTTPTIEAPSPIPDTYVFGHVNFTLSIQGWPGLGGPVLAGNATTPNGTRYPIRIPAAIPMPACSIVGTMPDYLDGAFCHEWASDDHAVSVAWDGWANVVLMVNGDRLG